MLKYVLQHICLKYHICNFAKLKNTHFYYFIKLNCFVSFFKRVKNFFDRVEFPSILRLKSFSCIWKTNCFPFRLNFIPNKRNEIYNVNIILVIVYFNIKSKHFHFVYLGIGKHAFLLQLSHHKNLSLDFTFFDILRKR